MLGRHIRLSVRSEGRLTTVVSAQTDRRGHWHKQVLLVEVEVAEEYASWPEMFAEIGTVDSAVTGKVADGSSGIAHYWHNESPLRARKDFVVWVGGVSRLH